MGKCKVRWEVEGGERVLTSSEGEQQVCVWDVASHGAREERARRPRG